MNLSDQQEQAVLPSEQNHEENIQPQSQQKESWYSAFIPSKGYVVTPVLIYINLFAFILMLTRGANILMPDAQILLDLGANYRKLTLEGEPWRLLTSIFLHIGVIHLVLNMYALLSVGRQLEQIIGSINFAAFYLFTGIIASVTSLAWHVNTVSAGASGAIFGMFGIFIGLLVSKTVHFENRKAVLISMATLVGYNLAYGMKDGIDNAAHVGGLVSGLIFGGFAGSYMVDTRHKFSYPLIVAGGAVAIVACWIGLSMTPNTMKIYEDSMKLFDVREKEALAILRMDASTSKDEIQYQLTDRGVYYWQENIETIKKLKKYDLPDNITNISNKLIQYCELRIQSYQLMSKSIVEETDKYNDQLEKYNKEIEKLVASMK